MTLSPIPPPPPGAPNKKYQTNPFFLPTRTKHNHLHFLQTNPSAPPRRPGAVSFLNMLIRNPCAALILLAASPLRAQNSWFQPSLLEKPEVRKAMLSVDERATGIVEEWIRLVETPSPSGKEQARAKYIRAEMEKLGLSDIRTDDMSNVSGVRKGTGGGPTVVFAAHMDTVFPEGTDLKVKREGDTLRAPGVGDDTSNLMATLEMFRALNRGGVKTKGDLIFLASVQEETGLYGDRGELVPAVTPGRGIRR
jgi:tripeptide aminopeptidase